MDIKVKYLADILKFEKLAVGDWIDLRASKRFEIKAGEFALIPLGVSMELPEGYEAHVVPRSSTMKNFGVIQTNSVGIIDNSYRGEWHMPVLAIRDTVIEKNDRICQFRIMENQPKFNIIEVNTLSDTERGTGGFGSTGKN